MTLIENNLYSYFKPKNALTRWFQPIAISCLLFAPISLSLAVESSVSEESSLQAKPVSASLPDPLTLEYALALAEKNKPVMTLAENNIAASRLQTQIQQSNMGASLSLKARARWIESPAALAHLGREDHAAKIVLNKPLYDFGRTSNRVQAGSKVEELNTLQLQQNMQTLRLQVMRAFFDVLLADLSYARANEAMAMGYIYYDRAKERQSVGQRSELDVLEKDSDYQASRQVRYESESQQRLTRNYLSLLLDRPGNLPSKLIMPKLEYHKKKIKPVENLQEQALKNNLTLAMLHQEISALSLQMKSIRAQRMPVLSAELETGVYEREIGSNDRWRAGVVFDMPLYQGGKVSAETALKKTEIDNLQIRVYQEEQLIKQQVLEHWLTLSDLSIQAVASNTLYDYREYYLDRARALYEMEVKSDLGDSMVELSAASFKVAEAQFEIAMRWEMLAQITQMSIEEMAE